PHEPFRITRGSDFTLEAKLRGEWKPLYGFSLQEHLLPDYEMANWYVSSHPQSRFVNGLIAARAMPDRRYALLNNEFAVHYLNGRTERRVLTEPSEIRGVLQGPFRIALPAAPQLDTALQRLASVGRSENRLIIN